jgi:hypothetical protein
MEFRKQNFSHLCREHFKDCTCPAGIVAMQQIQTLPFLLALPQNWPLVPVKGKAPYQKGWNSKQYDRLEILTELESGKATGVGLKLGNGLLAIDIDGESAAKLLGRLAGENSLADFSATTAWTSGRQGRKQCLFSVPEKDWCRIKYRRILTGVSGDDGKEECLEFRWTGQQSVLPPSIHPGTGKPYIWINNPLEIPPVSAPEWLIDLCENWHSEYVGDGELDLVRVPVRTQNLPILLSLPESWPLVPVAGKRPYQKGWNSKQYDRLEILTELQSGKATGVGLKLGNGLLAIDIDGESAAKLLVKLAGENSLADFSATTAWTSGRQGRKQCLFSVPEKDWCRLRKGLTRIGTGITGEDGKEEGLEFRWLGNQSVLPPSIHPTTNKPYIWLKNPLEIPPVSAPEWLIDLCENWHSEYAGAEELDLVRFPARLYAHFDRQIAVWLLARRSDISRRSHGGKCKGSGIGEFSLLAASRVLKRSKGHIRKLLGAAKKSGLIRNYKQKKDWVTVYYASLEKAIALTGIEQLGPIAAINIDDLANIHIIATEVEAQNLQRASLHRQQREEIEQIKAQGLDPGKTPTQIVKPIELHTCDYPARVLRKGDRFIYCDSEFRFYGGSQSAIAQSRGLSPATVSRHLSNGYRLVATPVRGYREELPPIVKKQLVEKLPLLKKMPSGLCLEDGLFSMHGDWWKPHCNVYLLDHRLVSARRRRVQIRVAIDKVS